MFNFLLNCCFALQKVVNSHFVRISLDFNLRKKRSVTYNALYFSCHFFDTVVFRCVWQRLYILNAINKMFNFLTYSRCHQILDVRHQFLTVRINFCL